MNEKEASRQKKYIVAIVIVSVLLVIALTMLIIVLVRSSVGDSISPDNTVGKDIQVTCRDIGEGTVGKRSSLAVQPLLGTLFDFFGKDKVTLSFLTGYDGEKEFSLTNMFPGDSESKEYIVTVKSKNAVGLLLDAEITSDSLMSSVLNVDVKANGTTLYSGTLADMEQVSYELKRGASSQEVTYQITVSLPTSVGNEYSGLSLTVNFLWSLTEKVITHPSVPPSVTETEPPVTEPDPPVTEPDPPVTEPDPPVTEPAPPVTEPDPPVTEPDPPVTEPDPPVTEPDPPVTEPEPPVDPHECCDCFICNLIARIFGKQCTRCIICCFVTWIVGSGAFVCICPWCCVAILLLIILILAIIFWLLIRKRCKEQEQGEEGVDTDELE